MQKNNIIDLFGWGIGLWLIGYILGIVFFMFLPHPFIGWVILPIGVALTVWVLFKKIQSKRFSYYILLGFVWTLIAIFLDYLFVIKLLKPADGYYKLDVYIYYVLTLVLPLFVGWRKTYEK